MSIEVSFPGGKRVEALVGAHRIITDQPPELGGEDAAPAPFDLFLASLATCAGVYVLGFCQARGIPLDGVSLAQDVTYDPSTKLPVEVRIELRLPPTFPEKYVAAVTRAAEGCKVKKAIAAAPRFEVVAVGPKGKEDRDVQTHHVSTL